MNSSGIHRIIPPDGQRCCWMTAGVLSYQLCDRDYDCDDCPLDAAMRKRFSRQEDSNTGREVPRNSQRQQLREELLYSRDHYWVRKGQGQEVRIGIEPGLSAALIAPKTIVFPTQGQHIQKGQTCLWIVLEGGTLPFEAPLGGTVRNNNRMLGDNPHLLNDNPYDEGWLFDLNADDGALSEARLIAREDAISHYHEDETRFLRLLGNASQGNGAELEETLPDGEQRLRKISGILGPGRYFSVIRKCYSR
jgi:glycine cleavage system H protein